MYLKLLFAHLKYCSHMQNTKQSKPEKKSFWVGDKSGTFSKSQNYFGKSVKRFSEKQSTPNSERLFLSESPGKTPKSSRGKFTYVRRRFSGNNQGFR